MTPSQPHRADSGAARKSPCRTQSASQQELLTVTSDAVHDHSKIGETQREGEFCPGASPEESSVKTDKSQCISATTILLNI